MNTQLYKDARRLVRRFVLSPAFALNFWRFRRNIARRNWRAILTGLEPIAAQAEKARDTQMLRELSFAALRLGQRRRSIELYYRARELDDAILPTDWRGEDISDATLIVRVKEAVNQGAANGVALCGYVRAAAGRAAKTIVVAERRLVPLFQRTLPMTEVVPFETDPASGINGRFVTATTNDLEFFLGRQSSHIHLPLAIDTAQADGFRREYLQGRPLPLIGLAWWSSREGKELPALHYWSRIIRELPAQYISLQYGDIDEAIRTFNGAGQNAVLVDQSVDQMKDIDRFASQIAALDLVITISNTGAHLAGAIGIPMILIRDDLFRRNWPYLSRQAEWYPQATIIGKEGRPWDAVFDEIIAVARSRLAERR